MKSILRAGLATLTALVLAVGSASAIEYNDVIGLVTQNVSDRTIVELIVKDGRAFEMDDEELARLRSAGASQIVIDAMLDPAVGQDWLDGVSGGSSGGGGGGYSTSLDEAYGQGYSSGLSTALVFSFGYYYGPLSYYYHYDPFYYPFMYSGYGYSYWPSYYAYYYRPAYSWCYSYPYNYYNYGSYYCHSYYDPGYYAYNGYNVQPGYGRTVWDNGPRWRDGGLPPSGTGRVDAGAGGGTRNRATAGQMADGDRGRARSGTAPVIREAQGGRGRLAGSQDLVARTRSTVNREIGSARVARGSSSGETATSRRSGREQVARSRSVESSPKVERAPRASADPSPRVIRGSGVQRGESVPRGSSVQRGDGDQRSSSVQRGSSTQRGSSVQRGSTAQRSDRVQRSTRYQRGASGSSDRRQYASANERSYRAGASSDRGRYNARVVRSSPQMRSSGPQRGGQSRSGTVARSAPSGGQSSGARGGGGGGGATRASGGGGGGGARGGGGGMRGGGGR